MSPVRGRRGGMAILSVEVDEISADRVLIRIRTVDDLLQRAEPVDRAFSAAPQALDYLREWLDGWTSAP